MPLRELLLMAAVPVSAEQQRRANQQQHVHGLLRSDGVVSRVFGHVQATSASRSCRDVGTLITEDELLAVTLGGGGSGGRPCLPDVVQTCRPAAGAAVPDSAAAAGHQLHWLLQLLARHWRRSGRQLWKFSRRGIQPEPHISAGRRRRADKTAGRGGLAHTLRQVGGELRRIADQLHLSTLAGWQWHEDVIRYAAASCPLLSGVAGCAMACSVATFICRSLRR